MKQEIAIVAAFLALAGTSQTSPVFAQDDADDQAPTGKAEPEAQATLFPIPDNTGDIFTRPALTGDWNGERTDLAKKGLQLKADVTQYYQGVTSGGLDDNGEWEYSGVADYRLLFDSGQAGLWPGGFIEVHGQSYWDETVNSDTGAVSGVNFQPSLSAADSNGTYLSHVIFTQFLSERFALTGGKIDTSLGDANAYAHGTGDQQFMNGAFNLNPTTYISSPYSVLGGGFIYLLGDEKQHVLAASVYDGDGQIDEAGFGSVFEDRTTVGASLQLKTNFFGMKGHQYFGAINGFGDYDEQTQDFRIFLPTSLTGSEAEQVNGTWTLFYNFDQQLIADPNNPERDIGVFGRFGIADKKSSVIRTFWSLGLGGNGLFPSRVRDGFGLGYYYMDFSSDRVREILPDGHEQGIEAFYNLAVTPALGITADLQVIDGALSGSDTAAVAGLRARVSF